MPVEVGQSFKKVDKAAQVFPVYKQLREDQKKLQKRASDSFDTGEQFLKTQLSEWSEKKQDFQDDVKTAFTELVKLSKLIKGSGIDSDNYLKKIFIKSLKELQPQLKEIFIDTTKKTLGCSTDQILPANSPQYIPVQSVDFFDYLTISADTKLGKLIYEPNFLNYYSYPFTMNKCLYDRIQNLGQPLSAVAGTPYVGTSTQNIFDIEYVEQYTNPLGQIIQGNFFKVTISNRSNALTVDEFLNDYFSTIDLFDQKNFYTQLVNIITGSVYSYKGAGTNEIYFFQKFMKILQRILGLCYDATPEIDVSGVAKISERDILSDDFFELSNLDLRLIEQKVSDIKLGIIDFEECDNIKVQMNVESVIDALSQITFVEGVNENNIINQTSNIINNTTDQRFKLAYDSAWIQEFPKALVTAILSPKVMLPFMTTAKLLDQSSTVDNTKTLEDFIKNYKTFLIEFMSQVGAIYTKIIYNLIRKDIKTLLKEILSDIERERKEKIKNLIFPLTVLGVGVSLKILKDFRDCKSIVDDLTKILSLVVRRKVSALQANPNADIPLPLLFTARLLEGASPTRSYINTVQKLEELGVPTGPMPDGSPNEFLAAIYAVIQGMDQENAENGKSVVAVGPLTVTPLFTTVPQKAYGKSF